ncbi:competence/damage-inducible protein A [Actinospongicola halichondriae]|uniref:competence/damage-inducible protein A n=1 Tax=Actinospongicola halichondriae TaxID=3236844 RepID=UPI003D492F8F
MRCEVVAIGTELLLGTVVDSNSAWIGGQLALSGVDCLRSVRVGDNHDRMVACIRESLDRADAVICCGGLGPTQDDVTREAIAEIMGVDLVRDDVVADAIRKMFSSRGRRMPDNNLRQADVPAGATVIHQTRGTAPGLICPIGDKVIYAVPGVPHEMKDMVERAVLPDLRTRAGEPATIVSRTLRTWGESESGLAERLDDHLRDLDDRGDVTLAFNASGIEGLRLRITAKGSDARSVDVVIAAEEAELRALLGDLVFGVDDETMEHSVGAMIHRRGLTLGLAESVTGGLIASRIVSVPGASAWFRGSVVSYASEVKFDVLDVTEGPVVAASAASEMATGARRVLGADIGLAVTGVAGPDEQDGQPVGTVFFATDIEGDVEVREVRLPGDRERVRQFACISALDSLRHRLLEREGA